MKPQNKIGKPQSMKITHLFSIRSFFLQFEIEFVWRYLIVAIAVKKNQQEIIIVFFMSSVG